MGVYVADFTVLGTTYNASDAAVSIPSYGNLTIMTNGSWYFKPAQNFYGTVPNITYSEWRCAVRAAAC